MVQLIKVAVIGPDTIVREVIRHNTQYEELDLIPVPYKSEKEAIKQAIDVDGKVDVILFTGPVPYTLVREKAASLTSPMMFINYIGTGLYKVLFKLVRAGHLNQMSHNRISFDYLSRDEVVQTFEELDLDYRNVKILQHTRGMTSDSITNYHYDLWRKGEIDAVITCLYSVYENLERKGIPAYCIIPTRSSILSALERVLVIGNKKMLENQQIAVCLVTVEDEEHAHLLRGLSDYLQTSGQKISTNTNVFYTTKGLVFRLTDGFKQLPAFFTRTSSIYMGIGIGQTANEALVRSHGSLNKCVKDRGNVLYIVGDSNTVIKISTDTSLNHLEYDSRSCDENILKVAADTNLSVSTLSKINYIVQASGKWDLSSQELSNQLNITLRSARRILKALNDKGYAEIVGEEQPIERGRPRQIYRLLF